MIVHRNYFYSALFFVTVMSLSGPSWAASWTQVKYIQTSEAQSDFPLAPTTESQPASEAPKAAAASTVQKPAAKKQVSVKKKQTVHKKKTAAKHHKKSPQHVKNEKKAGKTVASHHTKATKKVVHRVHSKEVHRAAVVAPKKTAKAQHRASTHIAAVPVEKAPLTHAVKHAAGTPSMGSKSVAYTFCLGYSNCTPTRYEMTGGKTRIMQQDEAGEWAEGKVDPVVASDLNQMAQNESQHTVVRDLTPEEKTRIAAHQGQVHAQLVGEVQGGPDRKEQVKAILRDLHIRNASDLEAYDPKLVRSDVAMQTAQELSGERSH